MATKRTALVAATVTAALVATGAYWIPDASAAEATAGAPGAGDSYFPLDGNGGFDIGHYDLGIDYDPAGHHLAGHTTITATASQDLSRFDLDLTGLTVGGVTVDGRAATFTRDGQELVITPTTAITAGKTFVVAVDYAGTPQQLKDSRDVPIGWTFTADGAYVASEPDGSHGWYPSSDHPSDKATYDFTITVPTGTAAIANGRLVDTRDHDGRTTYRWHEPEPMTTYASTATIGKFTLATSTLPGGVVVTTAVQPDKLDASAAALARLPAILDFYAGRFGPYPFRDAGVIIDDAQGYQLETQTRPLLPGPPKDGVLEHELAHQWFGNAVTPKRWKDVWLNEGFASYAQMLWNEHNGDGSLDAFYDSWMKDIPDTHPMWKLTMGDLGARDMLSIYMYSRGLLFLQALRRTIGDDAFFTTMRTWVQSNRYANATTRDFQTIAEQASGKDLGDLVTAWVYTPSRPPYTPKPQ